MIYTHDHKEKATYNVKELGSYMRECLDYQEQKKQDAINKAEAFYDGYRAAIREIAGMMGASNYRAEETESVIEER